MSSFCKIDLPVCKLLIIAWNKIWWEQKQVNSQIIKKFSFSSRAHSFLSFIWSPSRGRGHTKLTVPDIWKIIWLTIWSVLPFTTTKLTNFILAMAWTVLWLRSNSMSKQMVTDSKKTIPIGTRQGFCSIKLKQLRMGCWASHLYCWRVFFELLLTVFHLVDDF